MIGANRGHSWKLGTEQPFVEQPLPNEDPVQVDDDGRWIAEQRTMPVAEAEKEFGLEPGTLRKAGESQQ